MRKYWNKHSKEIIVGVIVLFILCIVSIIYLQKPFSFTKSVEGKIPDNKRNTEALTDTFYSDQLSSLEKENYELLKRRMETKEGGIVEFTEALTGEEYLRITSAISYENSRYFYGLIDIPMTKNDVCVSYNSEVSEVTDSIITKCILFISAAEGINEQGEYDKDGTVTNLTEIAKGLSTNQADKIKEIEMKESDTEEVISKIIEGIPFDYGEKQTIDYFLRWMDENLTFNWNLSAEASEYQTMEEMIDGAYANVNTVCVLDGKAAALGYVKLLTELCNRAGIPSHVVMGSWGNSRQSAYALCAVKLGDVTYYIDASGSQAVSLSNQRYITEKTAKRKMTFTTYFIYQEE